MNSKEIMVNLMIGKICKHIDAGNVRRIVVHGKEFVKVKKGKWIDCKASNGLLCAKCSECKTSYGFLKTPFCPNCGADMRGKDDEID